MPDKEIELKACPCCGKEHFMWSVKNVFLQRTDMRGRSSQRKHGTVELTEKLLKEKLLKGGNNGFGSSGR
jgi:hypothetical protein